MPVQDQTYAACRKRSGLTAARAGTSGRRGPSDQNRVGQGRQRTAAVKAATAAQRIDATVCMAMTSGDVGDDVGPSTQAGIGVGTCGVVRASACVGAADMDGMGRLSRWSGADAGLKLWRGREPNASDLRARPGAAHQRLLAPDFMADLVEHVFSGPVAEGAGGS